MASTITADPHYPPNEYRIPLQDQWNLITMPVNASIAKDQITIRNNSIDYNFTEAVNHKIIVGTFFGWDRENQTYYIANNLGFETGKGYWLWAYYPCSLIIHSDVRGDGYITKLQSQWNMMGQTYNSSLALTNLRVLYKGTSYSWANATTANNEEGHPLLIVSLFKWDGANQWYDLSTRLTPGEGYWMYAYYNCSLRQVIDAPVIIDHSLDTTGTGDSYVCNASVSDPDGVSSVWLEYWYTGGPHLFVQMNPTGVGSYYEKLLTIPSASVDPLHYIIVANDTKNYWNTTLEQTVLVNDDDAPVIANVLASPSSTSQNGYVNISCDVSDNIAVKTVRLHLTYPDLSTINLSMNKDGHYYLNQSYPMGSSYQFFIWANDTSSNSNTSSVHTFTITSNTHTITASAGTGGSITPSGAVVVNHGAYKNFTITPSTGYHILDVLVDGGSVGAVTYHNFTNVNTDHSIAASFAINTYTISASAGAGGSIVPSGAVVVNYGGYKNFTIAPNSGYIILNVLVDSISAGAVPYYNFTNVIANHIISASFKDNTPPTLSLNFAGNPSDSGGPYYLPGTNTPAPEGYYTNASYQKEKWIQIKCTATDNVGMDKVWFHWRNSSQWTNNTYQLTHTTGDYYEINMSTNIAPGPKYSFDLLAVDTSGNTMLYRWLKIGADTTAVDDRRYVQLGGTPTNISYTPYYFYPAQYKYTTGYGPGHNMSNDDNLHHDQGPDGTLTDSGYLLGSLPTNVVQERYCTMYVGYWFDETVTARPGTIKNIYHHFWWHTNNHNLTVAYGKSDAGFYRTEAWGQSYPTNTTKARTNISYNSLTYYLESALMKITSPQSYTDNDIYEFFVEYLSSTDTNPTIINNRSIQSFVIFNIPDNTILQGTDTDADGLIDYQELYVTFTNPFVQDTDNDGVSDYYETVSGSDPNDYKDTINTFPVLSSESPQNQSKVQPLNPPLSININQSQNHLMNVTFRTNASGTWQTIGTNLSAHNGTCSQTPTTMNSHSTTYYWSVHCNAGSLWTNETYHFTTWAEPRGWIYYKKITVNHSLVNQSLTHFPILIMTTDTDLVNHAQPSARDVQFWDATNTTRYHHEIERYNETTGEFISWVNITYLSATQDTIIWMKYGNTTCGSQENVAGTWDNNYVMVQHLNEAGNIVYDSTAYSNNGLSTGTDFTATGKIDGGRQYNDNDKIVANNFIHSPNALTTEAWVYRDATAFIYIGCKGTYSTSSDWILYLRNNQPANQGIDFSIKNHTSYIRKGDTPVNHWFYLTATYNSGNAALYFNGTQIGSGTEWPSIPNFYLNLGIGNDYLGTNGAENPMTHVKFDEFRVSKIARNSSWIKTSYNTISQPASFIHIGAEEQITYSLTVTQNGTGTGNVQYQPSGPYHFGTIVKLWANASVASTFTGWSGALSGTVSPQTLTMDNNKAVNAEFTHLNQAPTHTTPLLISEYGTNTTDEKLICTNQSTVDPEGNPVYNTYHWIKNGVSVPNLLLSFNNANNTNVKDYSGYHNNGTVINGTTWISSGKIGGAYKFDGTNDYISIPDASSLDGDGTWNAMSMEFWVKSGKDAQKNSTILEKRGATGATQSYQIGFSSTNGGRLYCGYYLSTAYQTTGTSGSTPILAKDVWYHVVSTYKSGEGLKIYVNGSLYTSLTYTTPALVKGSDGVPVNIGRRRTDATKFLNGSVDEVKIYPYALTQQQISQNYNDSKNGYSNAPRVVKEETSIGDVWRCEVTPSDGKLDGLTKASNSLTIVPVYTLTMTKSGSGSGTVEVTPSGPYHSGTVVTLWANASTGSAFTRWSGALSGTTTPETLTMDAYKTVNAEFTSTSLLTIKSSFDSASIGSYTIDGNSMNFTLRSEHLINSGADYEYWTNFKVQNTLNRNITFRITNANLAPFLSNTGHEVQMVYSYDGLNWNRFTNHTYAAGTYKFWKNFTSNHVQIATFYPFNYTMMQTYLETVNASQYAVKTVLGKSVQNRDIPILVITNSGVANNTKKVIYIIGRQHAAETASSHMLKGLIDFLISNSVDAQQMRDNFIWYIVPIVNPDGVSLGNSRGNGTINPIDINREWDSSVSTEINIVKNHLTTIKNTIGVDFFIDWHSQMDDDGWYNYIYTPPETNSYYTQGQAFFANLSSLTDFDTQKISNFGSNSARGYAGITLGIFTFTFEPTPHLSTWTLDSLHQQGVNVVYAIKKHYPIPPLLTDSEFTTSSDSNDLIANATTQDWYESRNDQPSIISLDSNDVANNTGKKARFADGHAKVAYLTQELRCPQNGRFNISLDMYIEMITAYYNETRNMNRTGFIYVGNNGDGNNGPCSTGSERFVYLTFYDPTPGDTGNDIELRAYETAAGTSFYRTNEWTLIAANLSYATWYSIKLDINFTAHTYDVYINDVFKKTVNGFSGYTASSLSYISFYVGGTARGEFSIDNVFSPAAPRHHFSVTTVGNGSLVTTPGESTYMDGSFLQISAFAQPGWSFDHWTGNLSGSTNPKTITITNDMNVTAVFTQNEYTITTHKVGTGSITIIPSQPTYHYNAAVTIQVTPDSGWTFTHWIGDLSGHVNPTSICITENIDLTAYFSNTAVYTLTTNVIGNGVVNKNPDWAIYEPSATVTLTPVGNNSGWTFNNWTGNISSGHEHDNPLTITMDANKIITAHFKSSEPTVLAAPVVNIASTSATLQGYINNTGGENCSVWFEYDYANVEECMGIIATGTVCKDGRSIIQKNRHFYYDNVKTYYYQGTNYSFFGIGDSPPNYVPGQCRMGQNEKGLAINNMDVGGTITHWKYQTDWASGSQDNDARHCLGNYSTVRDAAYYLAKHGYYYGNGNTNGQYLIISSEPGVGAIVAIDRVGHTNITWINNTYAGCANSWYCDGKWDTGDYNDKRAKIIMNDIVQNGTSSDGDHLLNWQDIAQRVAKDTSGREKGTGSYSFGGQIACGYSRSSVVSVAGNTSRNSSIHMSWVGIGRTTQIAIFLPLYAGNLHSINDIPSYFTTANSGRGMQPYADVKQSYARGNLADGNFYCSRVREILKYTNYNENLTFNAFDNVMDTIMYSADQQEVRSRLDSFMDTYGQKALNGYLANTTKSSYDTFKSYPHGLGYFSQTVSGLQPGTRYYMKAWANNTGSSANASLLHFMTKPLVPTNTQAHHFGDTQVNLTWTKGNGSYFTIIERNASGVSSWVRGEGIPIYNGTGNKCIDSAASSTVQYYYQFWSYTAEKGLHQFSTTAATAYTGSNMPPVFTNINPNNGVTGVLTNTSLLSVTIQDPEGNPIFWTIQTSPNIGSSSGSGGNGTKTCSISGLTYGRTYTWFVNATDGTTWNNKIYTFTTKVGILVDPDFDASIHSADLRNNSAGQDWYESRAAYSGGNATLLTLDTNNIGGNTGKKAGLKSYGIISNAYLTQEFGATQVNFFTVSFDIYIDRISDNVDFDRTGLVYIGDNSSTTNNCPTGTSNERFVHMTFYDPTPGDTGNDIQIRARTSSTQATATTSAWTQVAIGLNYDTWYTIKLIVFPSLGKYNVYLDGVLKGYQLNKYSGYASSTVSFMSFSADSDGRGDFYVDNVLSVPYTNSAPSITSELPTNISTGVSISTSQLSVTIVDSNSDLLNYTIQTSPNIGSSSVSLATGGTKTCSISGLFYSTTYTWYVNATDGINWTRKTYTFTTQTPPTNNPPAISNPNPTNESTGVPITTSSLSVTIEDTEADPFNWMITTSPDVGSNSGTGAGNGVKSCTLTGLNYGTTYTWYVKTTDGNGWTNKSYTFITALAPVNNPPTITSPIPANGSTDISVSTSSLSITIQDPEGNPIDWTIQTSPNIGSNSATGEGNGSKTCSISGLNNYTTYIWYVNATDGTSWMKKIFYFTTKGLLADSQFDSSVDSPSLRTDTIGVQDWYESRSDVNTSLTLNTNDIGGNSRKKAALSSATSGTAYLSQEFAASQTGNFNVSFDIYIDQIYDNGNNDRTAHIFIGNNTGGNYGTNGPCSTAIERFICLAFYDSTPGSGNDIILKARQYSINQSFTNTAQWTNITTGLSYDTWYSIRLEMNVSAGTYSVYVNGVLKGSNIHKQTEYTSNYVTYMSFYVGGYSRGDFYVDNVHSPAIN